MTQEIIDKILDQNLTHPFLTTDYFSFFKYGTHRDFKRYLDQPKFYRHLLFHEYSKVKQRKANSLRIDRELFLKICQHRKIDTSPFMESYYSYHKTRVRNSTEYFPNLKKGEEHTLNLYSRPAGKYYSHSLTTLNLSDAILADPFDLYKFCVTTLKWKHAARAAQVCNSSFFDVRYSVPFLNYDSDNRDYWLSYLNLIQLIIDEYFLSKEQLVLAKHYYKCIKALIHKMVEINHKKNFYRENTLARKAKTAPFYVNTKLLKSTLRKGAKLFHPDKNPEGIELFKEFNKYYIKRDIRMMDKMIQDYESTNQ